MRNGLFIGTLAVGVLAALPMGGCAEHGREKAEKKEVEEKVNLADCPPAVQATISKALGTGTVRKVVREDEDGKMIYSAEAVIDSKQYEVNVAMDGTLISNKLEEEKEGQKDDTDSKNEDKK